MTMSNFELDIHISMLWDNSYDNYTSKGLNTPRALSARRCALYAGAGCHRPFSSGVP